MSRQINKSSGLQKSVKIVLPVYFLAKFDTS